MMQTADVINEMVKTFKDIKLQEKIGNIDKSQRKIKEGLSISLYIRKLELYGELTPCFKCMNNLDVKNMLNQLEIDSITQGIDYMKIPDDTNEIISVLFNEIN